MSLDTPDSCTRKPDCARPHDAPFAPYRLGGNSVSNDVLDPIPKLKISNAVVPIRRVLLPPVWFRNQPAFTLDRQLRLENELFVQTPLVCHLLPFIHQKQRESPGTGANRRGILDLATNHQSPRARHRNARTQRVAI